MNGIFIIVGLVWLALGIVVAVDANKYPAEAFRATGSSRTTWQVWPVVGGLLCGIVALVMAIIWFSSKKAAVAAAASGGGGSSWDGGYGSGGYPPPPPPPDAPPPPTP